MSEHSADDLTVVVVTWQGAHLIGPCLDSLRAQSRPHRVLVVDNASTDGTTELLERDFPEIPTLVLPENVGFAGGVAAALAQIDTRFVALLNNDATADPAWLEKSLDHLSKHPRCAAVTAKMLLSDRPQLVNNAGVLLLSTGYGADRGLEQNDGPPFDNAAEVFGFSGGAVVLRTLAVRAVGGMESSYFLYYEDTDLAWRLQLSGWEIHYSPGAVVLHQHAASTDPGSELFAFYNERNRLLTLIRCAPAEFVIGKAGRFVLTTASLALKHLTGALVPPAPVFSVRLRVRVLWSVLQRLGRTLAQRQRIGSRSTVSRRAVTKRWAGRDSQLIDLG